MRRPASGRTFAVIVLLVLPVTLVTFAGCGSDDSEPSARSVEDVALASAVDLRVTGCLTEPVRGAGSMIEGADGDPYILTAAHVVAGAEAISVRSADGSHDSVAAVVLAVDPANDVALLGAHLSLPALSLAELAGGDKGVAIVFRDGLATVQPFTIVNPAVVNILDIYGVNTISRPGYRVAIEIEPGDSGAVLVGPTGQAGGVLYARTRSTDETAFATNTSPVAALVEAAAGADRDAGIDSGDCP